MNRRQYLSGATASVSGVTLAIGSGAFSVVRADRNLTIDVADDTSAYLCARATRPTASTRGWRTGYLLST